MPITIKPADFTKEMNRLLDQYGAQVAEVANEAVTETTKEAAKQLKNKNLGGFENRSGQYRRGWRAGVRNKRTGTEGTAYNKTAYQLTHLLEFGHVKQNGGRTKKFPHISDVNDWAALEVQRKITEGVERL